MGMPVAMPSPLGVPVPMGPYAMAMPASSSAAAGGGAASDPFMAFASAARGAYKLECSAAIPRLFLIAAVVRI